jgi:hypothetical protein
LIHLALRLCILSLHHLCLLYCPLSSNPTPAKNKTKLWFRVLDIRLCAADQNWDCWKIYASGISLIPYLRCCEIQALECSEFPGTSG